MAAPSLDLSCIIPGRIFRRWNEMLVFSNFQLFVGPWTVACRLLCPWDSPGKYTGVGCHALLLPDSGIEPTSLMSPALAGGFFTTSTTLEARPTTTSLRKTVLRMSGLGQVVISYHCWGVAKQMLQNKQKGETFISLPAKENKMLVPWIPGIKARGGVIRCMFVF